MEGFIDIPQYEGIYQVNNQGKVYNLRKNIFMSQRLSNKGYYRVSLSKDGVKKTISVHQLVGLAFLDAKYKEKGLVVDHKDNNSKNNNLWNLQIINNRENCSKDRVRGTSSYTGVRRKGGSWESRIRDKNKLISIGYFPTEIEAHHAYQNKLKEIEEARSSENLPQIP